MRAIVPRPTWTRGERLLTKSGQRILEHRRVELEGLAVWVEVGACEAGAEQRRTEVRAAGEDLVDEAVLRAA